MKALSSPLFSLGFRPFFMMSLAFFIFVIFYFTLAYAGVFSTETFSWDLVTWHRHEMIFGYSSAVIAGFLFTAVPNWTGHATPKNLPLFLICLFWVLGRVAIFFSSYIPKNLVALIDIPFYLVCALGILPALIKSKNKRNYFFILLLIIQSVANSIMHYGDPALGMRMGLNIIVLIMLIIGGRVIPFFTENATGIKIFRNPLIEKTAMICAIIAAILDVWRFAPLLSATALLIAAFANLWRFSQWKTIETMDNPLLWVLHLGYAWLVVGMFLKSAELFGFILPNAVANHAFTIGGIVTLTIGMMARVSLGHTGRPLKADFKIISSFIMVAMAAFIRVFLVWFFPQFAIGLYIVSAFLLCFAFLLMAVKYFPIFLKNRL